MLFRGRFRISPCRRKKAFQAAFSVCEACNREKMSISGKGICVVYGCRFFVSGEIIKIFQDMGGA